LKKRAMVPQPHIFERANVNDKANFMTVGGAGVANAEPDATKIKPIILNLESAEYYAFGEVIAKAYTIGKELKGDPTR